MGTYMDVCVSGDVIFQFDSKTWRSKSLLAALELCWGK